MFRTFGAKVLGIFVLMIRQFHIGLLTINRLIDPGRRIEYNFLGSINRKADGRGHKIACTYLPRLID